VTRTWRANKIAEREGGNSKKKKEGKGERKKEKEREREREGERENGGNKFPRLITTGSARARCEITRNVRADIRKTAIFYPTGK